MACCVAIAHVNCEAKAQQHLARQGFESYIPKTMQRLVVGGKKIYREQNLFGRYFFVFYQAQWRAIMSTVGVAQVLLNGELPSLVSDAIVEDLKARERNGCVVLPKLSFNPGQPVKIESGELVGFQGLYAGMSARDREIVLLNMMGRWVKTELAAGDTLVSA